jgi:hypothetical protein
MWNDPPRAPWTAPAQEPAPPEPSSQRDTAPGGLPPVPTAPADDDVPQRAKGPALAPGDQESDELRTWARSLGGRGPLAHPPPGALGQADDHGPGHREPGR